MFAHAHVSPGKRIFHNFLRTCLTVLLTGQCFFLYPQNHVGLLTQDRPSISILVPLCGKSLDLHWLYQHGHSVVGVELSGLAAKQFFEENGIQYTSEGDFLLC